LEPSSDTPHEGAAEREPGPIGSLLRSLAKLAATFVGVAHTRLELFTTELQQEMYRVAEIMVWTVIALLAAGIGLFLAALVIVFVFWDTHRVLASIVVTSVFFLIAVVALVVLRVKIKSRPPLLEGTLAELATDASSLKSAARARRNE
jgi:uncharacterized membrane protein YqjE